MKNKAKKIFSWIGASVLSLASLFSLATVTFQNEQDLTSQTVTTGGGGITL